MKYAKERYKTDKDYQEGSIDLGRRTISKEEEEKYQKTNHIKICVGGCRLGLSQKTTSYIKEEIREIGLEK